MIILLCSLASSISIVIAVSSISFLIRYYRKIDALSCDVVSLQRNEERRLIKEDCANGNHDWEMNHCGCKPVISCKQCHTLYKESKK